MADVLSKGLNEKYSGGLKTPSQMKTISGPGVRVNNKYGVEKQGKLSITKK